MVGKSWINETYWVITLGINEDGAVRQEIVVMQSSVTSSKTSPYPDGKTVTLFQDRVANTGKYVLVRSEIVSHWVWNGVDVILVIFGITVFIAVFGYSLTR